MEITLQWHDHEQLKLYWTTYFSIRSNTNWLWITETCCNNAKKTGMREGMSAWFALIIHHPMQYQKYQIRFASSSEKHDLSLLKKTPSVDSWWPTDTFFYSCKQVTWLVINQVRSASFGLVTEHRHDIGVLCAISHTFAYWMTPVCVTS